MSLLIQFRRVVLSVPSPFSRLFSWKSRQNRDPEARIRKQESLNKRYTLRRLGELPDEAGESTSSTAVVARARDQAMRKVNSTLTRVLRLSNVSSIDKAEVYACKVGESVSLSDLVASISTPSPRSAIVVVKDRGNTERVFKALKREFSSLQVSLMDRDRVELKLPEITDSLRENRGQLIDALVDQTKKELKKLELQVYADIKQRQLTQSEVMALRVELGDVFLSALSQLEKSLNSALDDLGLDPY